MAKPVEVIPTSNDVSNKNDDSGDTKKKTRNRKKKPKKENKEKAASLPTAIPTNPHSILRSRLVDEGFSIAQVDKAMEEMWDKNLVYDDFDAVVAYLKCENQATEDGESSVENNEEGVVGTMTVVKADQKIAEPIKPAPLMTMEQRLETVANFETLTDSIFALTEWINKAAKPRDLEDLCAATKTKALVTIFQRSITEARDQTDFDRSILPSMARLMGSLLGRSGISESGVSETQNAFESLLRKARSVYLMQHPDTMDFLQRVSRFIVSRISLAVGESNASSVLPVDLNLMGLKAPVSVGSPCDSNIAALLSEREIHLTAAKRYGAMTSSLCASLSSRESAKEMANGPSANGVEIGTSAVLDIMLALVGEDAKNSYELQKANLEELESQAKNAESEKCRELREAIEEVEEERGSVAQRILELKISIEKLETYDAELCVKLNDMQVELQQEATESSLEAASLDDQIKEASEALAYGTRVIEVAHSLKKYDDSLDMAVTATSKVAAVASGDAVACAGKQMEIFLSHVLKYFVSEAETMAFLNNRIAESSKVLEELKSEIIDLEGLGLTTTIAQMKVAAEKSEASIEMDAAMLQRFKNDITSNFDALVARLHEYRSVQSVKSLQGVSTSVLGKILTVAKKLEVASIGQLDGFLNSSMQPDDKAISLSTSSPSTTKMGSMNGHSVEMPKTLKSTVAPKLTWAASKSKSNDETRLSILEIQKEELNLK